jgi:hypothetical protein
MMGGRVVNTTWLISPRAMFLRVNGYICVLLVFSVAAYQIGPDGIMRCVGVPHHAANVAGKYRV